MKNIFRDRSLITVPIGREEEQAILRKALHSNEAEMVAVIGRRRVGKTYLVNFVYGNRIKFDMTGIQNGSRKEQLQHFTNRLNFHVKPTIPFQIPTNWLDAFHLLSLHFGIGLIDQALTMDVLFKAEEL